MTEKLGKLQRLVCRIGYIEYEKELKIDKDKEERIETEIRQLQKERNRARLVTEKNQQPKKRQKIDEENYISIITVWGQPKTEAQKSMK